MVWRLRSLDSEQYKRTLPLLPPIVAAFYGISLGLSAACYANPLLLTRYSGVFLSILILATLTGTMLTFLLLDSYWSPVFFWSYFTVCLGVFGLLGFRTAGPSHLRDLPLLILTGALSTGLSMVAAHIFAQRLGNLLKVPVLESHNSWDETSNRVDLIPWFDAWHRLKCQVWGITGFSLIFSGFVKFFQIPVGDVSDPVLSIALFSLTIWSLLLHIQGHFAYQRASWIGERIEMNNDLTGLWTRWAAGILACLILTAQLLPASFSLQTRDISQFRADVRRPADNLPITARDVITVKKPTAWEIAIGAAGGSVLIVAFLIFLFVAALFLQGTLSNIVQNKPWLRVCHIFIRFWRDMARSLESFSKHVVHKWSNAHLNTGSQNDPSPNDHSNLGDGYHWGKGWSAYVRKQYFRIIETVCKEGYQWHPSFTPDDFARSLKNRNPQARVTTMAELTSIYQKARYGPGLIAKEDAQTFDLLRKEWKEKV